MLQVSNVCLDCVRRNFINPVDINCNFATAWSKAMIVQEWVHLGSSTLSLTLGRKELAAVVSKLLDLLSCTMNSSVHLWLRKTNQKSNSTPLLCIWARVWIGLRNWIAIHSDTSKEVHQLMMNTEQGLLSGQDVREWYWHYSLGWAGVRLPACLRSPIWVR